jgi:hypothetical protein
VHGILSSICWLDIITKASIFYFKLCPPGIVVHACNLSCTGRRGGRIAVQSQPAQAKMLARPSQKTRWGQTPATHACNPSNSGGTVQEDRSSKPAWGNSSQDPISKIPITKKVAQGVGPEFKPQYPKTKKNKVSMVYACKPKLHGRQAERS